jgi:hypothetical protein
VPIGVHKADKIGVVIGDGMFGVFCDAGKEVIVVRINCLRRRFHNNFTTKGDGMTEGNATDAKTLATTAKKAVRQRKPRAVAANGGDEKVKAIQTIVASEKFIVVAAGDNGVVQVLTNWA